MRSSGKVKAILFSYPGKFIINFTHPNYCRVNSRTPSFNIPRKSFQINCFHSSRINYKRDYYEILGVDRKASKDEIKKKYFQLAKQYHPDVNKNDPKASEKFREASEAYEVLENEEKRKLYDNFGHSGVDQSNMGGGGNPFEGFAGFSGGGFQWNFQGGGARINEEDLQDIFGQIFGQQRVLRQQGMDLRTSIRLSFFEAVNGCSKDILVSHCSLQILG